MALKNRDLTFIIKVQNSAKAALKSLRDDLTATGRAGKGMAGDLEKTAAAMRRLRDSAGSVKSVAQGIDGVSAASRRSRKATEDDGAAKVRISAMVTRSLEAEAKARAAANSRLSKGGSLTPANGGTLARGPSSGGLGAAAAATAAATRETIKLIAADNALTRAFDRVRDAAYGARQGIRSVSDRGIGSGIDALKAKVSGLSPALKGLAAFAGFSILARGVTLAAAAVAAPVRAFAEFEQAMSRVQAVAQVTKGELKPLADAALELSTATGLGAADSAKALQTLIQNGLSAADAITLLRPAADFAAVGELTLADSADVLTKTLAQFALPVEAAAKATDILNFVNIKTNTSIQDLTSALSYAGPLSNVCVQALC